MELARRRPIMPFEVFPRRVASSRRQRVIVELRIALSTFRNRRETGPPAVI